MKAPFTRERRGIEGCLAGREIRSNHACNPLKWDSRQEHPGRPSRHTGLYLSDRLWGRERSHGVGGHQPRMCTRGLSPVGSFRACGMPGYVAHLVGLQATRGSFEQAIGGTQVYPVSPQQLPGMPAGAIPESVTCNSAECSTTSCWAARHVLIGIPWWGWNMRGSDPGNGTFRFRKTGHTVPEWPQRLNSFAKHPMPE